MAKLSRALFSLGAVGALGKHLVYRKRGRVTVAQQMPLAKDARTSAQLQWRTMYQKAVALWHLLSPAEKAAWERQSTPLHMIGFAYFISQALKPNPGIYLPLAGGAMSGDIDMATNKILNLPAPTADEEPARKADLATHAALEAAIHGLKGQVDFSVHPTTPQSIPTSTTTKLSVDTKDWDVGSYFNLSANRYIPLKSGRYLFISYLGYDNLAFSDRILLILKKNGTNYKYLSWPSVADAADSIVSGAAIADANGTTDFFELYTWHNHGSARNTLVGPLRTYFQGFLIAQS